jgi:hypothetical protein
MPRAMEHQTALLLRCLGRDEPHVCPSYRFADCLGIGRIVLLSLDVGLYVSRSFRVITKLHTGHSGSVDKWQKSAGQDAQKVPEPPDPACLLASGAMVRSLKPWISGGRNRRCHRLAPRPSVDLPRSHSAVGAEQGGAAHDPRLLRASRAATMTSAFNSTRYGGPAPL